MDVLIFNERSNLPVYHAVELRDQYDIVAILPMLGEEAKPIVPAFFLPFTSIKDELRFVNDQHDGIFLDSFPGKILLAEADQSAHRQL